MEFKRVTKKRPCAVCGRPDWCGTAPDGDLAVCMRVESARASRNGGWLHPLGGEARPRPVAQTPVESPRARRTHLDRVYRALLCDLRLSDAHREALRGRGLSDSTIDARLYRTAPAGGVVVDGRLARLGLEGVPGFYYERGWRLAGAGAGILVPVTDSRGGVVAVQVRRDAGSPRYMWLSSSGRARGCSPGAPVHLARPELIGAQGCAVVTEGALKADVVADRLGCAAVGFAGLHFPAQFSANLSRLFPALRRVDVAFDADFRTNDAVRSAVFRLLTDLRLAGLGARVLTWEGAKGFDDHLARSAA